MQWDQPIPQRDPPEGQTQGDPEEPREGTQCPVVPESQRNLEGVELVALGKLDGAGRGRDQAPELPPCPTRVPHPGPLPGRRWRAGAGGHSPVPRPFQQGPPGAVFRFHKLREGPRRQRERVDEDIGATRDRGRPGGARESCAAPPGPRGDPPPKSHVT